MQRSSATTVSLAMFLSLAGAAAAGPLDPPPGPVASTMKPLDQVEPRTAIGAATTPGDADSLYRITQAGSYYLTGNVLGLTGKSGIEITVSDVTIDLMGFEMKGAAGSLDGIKSVGNLGNITIRNGTVAIWRQDGIDLTSAVGCHIEQIRVAYNYDAGLRAGGSAVVTGVTAPGGSHGGIVADYAASISNCTASGGSGPGITAGNGSTITGCVSQGNVDVGFSLANGCTIISCTADDNTGAGISADGATTVTSCTARSNASVGIAPGAGSTVTGCTAQGNTNTGIMVIFNGSITNCTASNNLSDGIGANSTVTITGNTVANNGGHGISVVATCIISGNTCSANDESGIRASSDNRIDSNNLTNNGTGVQLYGQGNFVVRNSCGFNVGAAFDFGGKTQIAGEISTATGTIADSVSPWANFAH